MKIKKAKNILISLLLGVILLVLISWVFNLLLVEVAKNNIQEEPQKARTLLKYSLYSPFSGGREYAYIAQTFDEDRRRYAPFIGRGKVLEVSDMPTPPFSKVDLLEAAEYYKKALDKGYDDPWIYSNLGDIYGMLVHYNHFTRQVEEEMESEEMRGQIKKALDYYDEVDEPPYEKVGFLYRVLANYPREDEDHDYFKKAAENYEKALERGEISSTSRAGLVYSLINSQEYERALEQAKRNLEEITDLQLEVSTSYQIGYLTFFHEREPREALEYFERALDYDHDWMHVPSYQYRVMVYIYLDKPEMVRDALLELQKAYEEEDSSDRYRANVEITEAWVDIYEGRETSVYFLDDEVIANLGYTEDETIAFLEYYVKDGAQSHFEFTREWGYTEMGKVYYERGNFEEAKNSFDKVLEINPDHTEAIYYRTLIAFEREEEEASEFLNRLRKADTEGEFEEEIDELEENL